MNNEIIYLDNNSTTPIDTRVLDAMLPYFSEYYGNASSSHYFGSISQKGVEDAREKVAGLFHSKTNEIIFTSGATEAINLAIKGYCLANINKGNHIITVKTEHSAVLDTCKYLESIGFEVTYLPVLNDGLIDISEFKNSIKPTTILASVMLVNNETGVIQDIKSLCETSHNHVVG
jgi:cysteine desulfurase